MPLNELEAAMKKQPKFIRTVRHNKHPVIMNPSYGDKFDEYKIIGTAKLEARAKQVRENKEFAEKIQSIKGLKLRKKNKINHKKTYIMKKVFILNSPQLKTTKSCLNFIQQSGIKKYK